MATSEQQLVQMPHEENCPGTNLCPMELPNNAHVGRPMAWLERRYLVAVPAFEFELAYLVMMHRSSASLTALDAVKERG